MFRGEPLALFTILTGFLFFLLTLILGLFMPDVLFEAFTIGIYPSHFVSAFLGWIGLVILGAQLQFFRAITATRKFEPEYLRPLYYIFAVSGLIAIIVGNLIRVKFFIPLGLALYSLTIIIHSYWIIPKINDKLFKFPLNYLLGSHLFFVIGIIMMWVKVIDNPFGLLDNFEIIHFLGIGWISLNIQGAMIRALPMFVGQAIDRPLRQYIDQHFYFSFTSSLLLAIAVAWLSPVFIWIGGIGWLLSWLWVIYLLVKSIFMSNRDIQYPITLSFMFPGLLFMGFGAMIGFHTSVHSITPYTRAFHIHTVLLAGLSLIMLGAMNRITSFQMFTLAYTGRRNEDIAIGDFINQKTVKWIVPGLIIAPTIMIISFAELIHRDWIAIGGILYIIHVLAYGGYLLTNFLHYRREMENALPYYLKKGETEEDLE